MGVTLSAHCGAPGPVGFTTAISVGGFPPSTNLGIDLLDLTQQRVGDPLALNVMSDATGAVTKLVNVNVRDGVYFVRVFVDLDNSGQPSEGQPEAQVRVAIPCDILYALMTQRSTPGGTDGGLQALEVVDLSASPPNALRTIQVGKRNCMGIAVSPDRDRVYLSDNENGIVAAFNATTDSPDLNNPAQPVLSVPLTNAGFIALSNNGKTLYANNDKSVVAIATSSMTISQTFTTPNGELPQGIALSPDGTLLAISARLGGASATGKTMIFLLDPATLSLKKTVPIAPTASNQNGAIASQPAFTDAVVNRLLLWDLCFDFIYQVDLATQAQLPDATVSVSLTIPPTTSSPFLITNTPLTYSPISQNCYVLGRPTSSDLPRLLDEVNPLAAQVFGQKGGFNGVPNATAMTPDGKSLYISVTPTSPGTQADSLDQFDTASHVFVQHGLYTFQTQNFTVGEIVILSSTKP